MLSSGNTSTKVTCNSVNTDDGLLYTNNANPYYYDQVLSGPNCVYGYSRQNQSTIGSRGGFSKSYFQILLPYNVGFLCSINNIMLNLTQQFIFVYGSTMDNVSGFYYNATAYSRKLIPCPEPPVVPFM